MSSLADKSIVCRVVRGLANLSHDPLIANEIAKQGVLPTLLTFLSCWSNTTLFQNTLRAIRLMSKNSLIFLKQIKEANVVDHFIHLLEEETNDEVRSLCLQTLHELMKTSNGVLAPAMHDNGGIKVVCKLSYSNNQDIAGKCIHILCTLTKHPTIRVSVGTQGGIDAFLHQVKWYTPLLLYSVEGVCMCCREAVNRSELRHRGGLEILLKILRLPQFCKVHNDILGAYTCFTHDDLALKYLLSRGFVSTLVHLLQGLLFPDDASSMCKKITDRNPSEPSEQTVASESTADVASLPIAAALKNLTEADFEQPNVTLSKSTSSVEQKYPVRSLKSPQRSPELCTSLMSSCSPESGLSSSPLLYSPSGSEDDMDDAARDFAKTPNASILTSLMEEMGTTHSSKFQNTSKNLIDAFPGDTVSKMPKTSLHDHDSLFLPEENLFSADQPSPVATFKLLFPQGKGWKTCSETSHSNGDKRCEMEAKIIYLLSRIGQMPSTADTETLTSPECVQTLLDYLCFSSNPEFRCVRLLKSLAWDRNLFETLIIIMFPGAVYQQLLRGHRPGFLLKKELTSPSFHRSSSRHIDSSSSLHLFDVHEQSDALFMAPVYGSSKITGSKTLNFENDLQESSKYNTILEFCVRHASAEKAARVDESLGVKWSEKTAANCAISSSSSGNRTLIHLSENVPVPENSCLSLLRVGESLISILTMQAGTSFGQGILAHLLLRGSRKHVEACALSLPLICK